MNIFFRILLPAFFFILISTSPLVAQNTIGLQYSHQGEMYKGGTHVESQLRSTKIGMFGISDRASFMFSHTRVSVIYPVQTGQAAHGPIYTLVERDDHLYGYTFGYDFFLYHYLADERIRLYAGPGANLGIYAFYYGFQDVDPRMYELQAKIISGIVVNIVSNISVFGELDYRLRIHSNGDYPLNFSPLAFTLGLKIEARLTR